MSHELINRSSDLARLRDSGYEVEIRVGHLLVHSIPYVNARREIVFGTLVSSLELTGDVTKRPDQHVAFIIGEHPCNKDGSTLTAIVHSTCRQQLAQELTVDHSFSNKPPQGYSDYFEKMTRYIEIISAPAQSLDPQLTAKTFKVVDSPADDGVFAYLDTASTRAGTAAISHKLRMAKVAIIGLGGTGSYVLDLLAKTPIREIHLFDADEFLQHNAFRSPSAPSKEALNAQPKKVTWFKGIYSNMHRGIVAHAFNVDDSNVTTLSGFDFVFLCIDSGTARKMIVDHLLSVGVPFIDTGIGIEMDVEHLHLRGACRITTGTPKKRNHLSKRIPFENELDDDVYRSNIQTADLNSFCAALAVIKWKKYCEFYADTVQEHDTTYTTAFNLLTSEEEMI
ncbi:MAG: ThiF family adenylyltransferase [Burkholderiales bacterium]|nr:ThiF family adenylyltransferase [Burkholderiales bacterium]